MPEFKNQKIRVPSEAISKLVQEALFVQGYSWSISGQKPANLKCAYLYTYEDGNITNGVTEDHFREHKNQEVRAMTESRLVLVELTPVRTKVIMLGGTYYKDDVEAALALLPKATV